MKLSDRFAFGKQNPLCEDLNGGNKKKKKVDKEAMIGDYADSSHGCKSCVILST